MIKKIIPFVLFPFLAFSQPSNDNCTGAISIQDGDVLLGSTLNATVDNLGTCGLGTNDYGVWYTFTSGSAVQSVQFSTCASSAVTTFDAFITVLKGDCSNLTCVNTYASWGSCNAGLSGRTSTFVTQPNTTYYAVVNNYLGTKGDFQLTMTASAMNDDCLDAVSLPVQSSCSAITHTNIGATNSGDGSPACGYYQGGDVWFKAVVPPSGNLVVQINELGSGIFNKVMQVYEGSCSTLTNYSGYGGCTIDDNPTSGESGPYFHMSDISKAGQTLYFQVFTFNNATGSNFDICAMEPASPPSYDDCSNAQILAVGGSCSYTTYTNAYAIGDPSQTAPACFGYQGKGDVWFKATVPSSGNLVVQIKQLSVDFSNKIMKVYEGSCGSLTEYGFGNGCTTNDNPENGENGPYIHIADPSIAGNTLYFRVYTYYNQHGSTFDICAFEPPSPPLNDDCLNAAIPTVGIGSCTYAEFSNEYAVGDPLQNAPACFGYQEKGDVWFKALVPASGNLIVQIKEHSVDFGNKVMKVYSGSCGSLVSLACSNNDNPNAGENGPYIEIADGTLAGQNIYIRVYTYYSQHGSAFDLCIYEPPNLTCNWTGAIDSDWNKSGNWDCGQVPTYIDKAIIPSSATNMPIVDGAIQPSVDVLSINLQNGAKLDVINNADLNVKGE